MSRAGVSRRRLLGVAGGAGATLVLHGCGGSSGPASRARAVSESDGADADVLDTLLAQEYLLLGAYQHVRPALRGSDGGLVDRITTQERRHIAGLQVRIGQLGGQPSRPTTGPHLPALHDRQSALALVAGLERQVIALYIDVLPKIADLPTRAAAASLVANEAQHVSLLDGARGLPPVPSGLVSGRA